MSEQSCRDLERYERYCYSEEYARLWSLVKMSLAGEVAATFTQKEKEEVSVGIGPT